eukprot:CAMPEP_0170983636 /NCGR_PEP_ID=MMETSP0736-20130129/4365_1 /TAXON_ID=186038 /ORGANISM="Fragilariopsis kerguelensis, Strain L26-C5" /LENGTH=221 /DNA_ID=CAMNT_0011407139 /DNA_START=214 /DNA_END=879 /DNA_ORIENTATION=+
MQITLFGDAHSKKGLHPVETSDDEEMLLMNGGRNIILRQTSSTSSQTSTPSIMQTDSSCSTVLTSPGDDHKRHIEDALEISMPAHPRAPPIPTDAQVHKLKITHQKKRSTNNTTGNRKQNKKNHHKNKKQPNPQQNTNIQKQSFYKRTEYFLDNLCVGVERDLLGPGDKDYERNKELFDRQQQEQTRKKHRQRFYVNHVWEPSDDTDADDNETIEAEYNIS